MLIWNKDPSSQLKITCSLDFKSIISENNIYIDVSGLSIMTLNDVYQIMPAKAVPLL